MPRGIAALGSGRARILVAGIYVLSIRRVLPLGVKGHTYAMNLLEPRWRTAGLCVSLGPLTLALFAACSSTTSPSDSRSATKTLRAAAAATAEAHSFTLSFLGVEVTYNAPDTVEQVEHGQTTSSGSSAGDAANGSGTLTTQATSPEVITKIFIGDRYYEADNPPGETPQFFVSSRSPCNTTTAASATLNLLRSMATSASATKTANGYRFEVAAEKVGNRLVTNSGTATIQDGYIRTVTFVPGSSIGWTITAVNNAPPVTAPSSAMSMNESCSSGSAASPTTSGP